MAPSAIHPGVPRDRLVASAGANPVGLVGRVVEQGLVDVGDDRRRQVGDLSLLLHRRGPGLIREARGRARSGRGRRPRARGHGTRPRSASRGRRRAGRRSGPLPVADSERGAGRRGGRSRRRVGSRRSRRWRFRDGAATAGGRREGPQYDQTGRAKRTSTSSRRKDSRALYPDPPVGRHLEVELRQLQPVVADPGRLQAVGADRQCGTDDGLIDGEQRQRSPARWTTSRSRRHRRRGGSRPGAAPARATGAAS